MNKEPKYVHVYDGLTGTETTREMTDEEYAEYEAFIANSPSLPGVE